MAKTASGPPAKKVFIVDDHPVFRDGLVRIAAAIPGVVVCGEADNARDAFDSISKLNPDLVLMDINLPGKSGLELLQDVHAMRPELPVLIISMHDEQLYAERVLRAGGETVVPIADVRPGDRVVDAAGLVVAPGLVDLAARLRVPGHQHEGLLESELAAAAAGGVVSAYVGFELNYADLGEFAGINFQRRHVAATVGMRF